MGSPGNKRLTTCEQNDQAILRPYFILRLDDDWNHRDLPGLRDLRVEVCTGITLMLGTWSTSYGLKK